MLVWSRAGRILAWAAAGVLFAVVYGLPIGVIALASFSGQWNDVLPSHLTLAHYANALRGDSAEQAQVSIITGLAASAAALVCGSWAALALRRLARLPKRVLDVRVLRSERGAFRLGRARPARRLQPAARAVERHAARSCSSRISC